MKTKLLSTAILFSGIITGLATVKAQTQILGAGSFHSLALCTSDSVIRAWGGNENGQLGIGDTMESNLPVGVHGVGNAGYLKSIVSLVARENFSLALRSDGSVFAWGYGGDGELGNNTMADSSLPQQVHGPGNVGYLSNIKAISGGYTHVLALRADSTVWAWGDNSTGALGDNTGINDSTPVQVHGYNNSGFLTGVVAIAAGQQFSLALKKDGSVWAWGSNATGQCGDYTSIQRNTPIQVHGPGNVGFLTGITALAAGGGHALALKNDSTVWSWGFNINGELGDNTQLTDSVPEQVHGTGNVGFLTGITYIKAGDYFSGAIDKNTNVWTWGYNYYGQCGINDTTGEEVNTPVEVHGPGNVGFLSGIVSISLGDEHVLALKNDGSLYTWGWNGNGQLGNDSTVDRWTPINIVSPCNVKLATPTVITGNNEIKFYPNPTNREINVANENHNISAIEIYNMLGEKTYESKVSQGEDIITTNVSFETAGVYLLRVETVGGTIVNKEFVIQK